MAGLNGTTGVSRASFAPRSSGGEVFWHKPIGRMAWAHRGLVVLLLAAGGVYAVRMAQALENPMAAPSFPVVDDEPEAVQGSPGPAATSAERLQLVIAPIPPMRPWSRPSPKPEAEPAGEAVQPEAEKREPEAEKRPPGAAGIPVDAPLPPRRAGSPADPVPGEPPAIEAAPAKPPPAPELPFSIEPDMRVAFAPPIAIPSTTEEIEAEEARAPEPTLVEKQTDAVDIACIKPEVMTIVRSAGEFFGATPVITSGQRDRGRRGSFHRQCMAADFFIPGIERARLAKHLRGQDGAGGVGTYCHTKSVHIDIGEPRNWYQCGRRFRFAQR